MTKARGASQTDTARGLWIRLSLLLAAFGANGCMASEQVERLVDGQSQLGGFIDERAYAYYARGRVLELEHSYPQALTYYQLAQEYDPESVELAVRVGTTLCQLRNSAAFQAFESAKRLDPRYAPLFTELSRCYLLERDRSEALAAATKAISLDPNGVAPNQQMLTLLRAEKDHLRLRTWYRGLLAQNELEPYTVRQLQDLAASDEGLLSDLRLHAKILPEPDAATAELTDRVLLTALATGNDAGFWERSRVLNLSELRVLGLLRHSGKVALATQLAERRYAAAPRDVETWVQLLWLTTLSGNESRFDSLLAVAPDSSAGLSPDSSALLSAILASKAGVLAAILPPAPRRSTLNAQAVPNPPAEAGPQQVQSTRPGVQH